MKEHGSKLPAEQPAKILKSLLKKPGQSKSRSHKNRVVINEKLNEFFAADYIILIKEECCADYEEDCDCCCQEHELIRLGNCKECRAELNLHFGVGDGGRYHDVETENSKLRRDQVCTGEPFGCVELHLEDEDEEEYEVETEGDEDEVEEEEAATKYEDQAVETKQAIEERTGDLEEGTEEKQAAEEARNSTKTARGKKKRERVDNETDTCEKNVPVSTPLMLASPPQPSPPPPPPLPPPPTPPPPPPPPSSSPPPAQPSSPASSSQEHQQETLSPPEGYKDVYSNEKPSNVAECCLQASSLDYLHCEGTAGTNVDGEPSCFNEDTKNNQDEKTAQNNEQQLQRSASTESRHRYLVETITMTTVTERRIVREISEEEEKERVVVDPQEERRNFVSLGKTTTIDDQDTIDDNDSIEYVAVKGEAQRQRQTVVVADARGARETRKATEQPFVEDKLARHESTEAKDLSLVFKLGNSSLTGNNSLKPNSAVRQLFPNPKFVSPPPAPPAKLISSANSTDKPENNSVLFPNTENLRLFDNTMSENQDYSSNDESNPIRRTIERNTLRRSLLDKYRANSRKKSLPSKNLSLEERIRQLTCVDQEDDEDTSQRLSDTENTSSVNNKFDDEMLVRAAPPGQEDTRTLPKPLTRIGSTTTDTSTPLSASTVHVATQFGTLYGTLTAATTATNATTLFAPNSSSTMTTTAAAMAVAATTVTSSNYYKQISAGATVVADHLHNQSTYKKLTELFVHKKNIQPNMPDLGLGNGGKNGCKDYQARNSMKANNSDTMRRQFLASLAPLSCVAVNSADSQEDYYRHNSRMMVAENHGSTYNTAGAYNLDNIETNLHQDDGNYINIGPPDVTKGTSMILDRPDIGDSTTDELLAFVEQDRFRTERIKRRYNDDQYHLSTNGTSNYISDSKNEVSNDHQQQVGPTYRDNNGNKNRGELQRVYNGTADNNIGEDNHEDNDKGNDNDNDDDDDELNDYGFNRRPSVTGIKQQRTDSGDESFHRPSLDNDNTNIPRTNFHPSMPTYYENNCIKIDSRIALYDETIDNSTPNSFVGTLLGNERNASTINRINTMQKQIDDIYQTIVENTNVTPQNSMEREPYTEEAFTRQPQLRLPINDPAAFRFYQEQRNSQQYFQEQLNATNVRTSLRGVAVGAEEIGTNGLAAKTRRTEPRTVTTPSNYHCNVVPTVYTGLPANTKCYRTMYFVPYNGLSDPTYQNIQRILPSHPSPSYSSHIERYPYPRSSKNDQLQTQTQTQPPSTPQLRYYHVGNRSLSPISNLTQANHASSVPQATLGHSVPPDTYPPFSSANPPVTLQPTQQTFHLHLHHHQQQPEDFRISGVAFHHQHQHQLQVQHQHQHHPHHRHHHQPMFYRLPSTIPPQPPPASSTSPSSSSYAVRFAGNGVATTESSYRFYQVHLGRAVVTPPTDLQNAPTFSSSTTSAASYSSSLPSSASYSSSLSSSFSSLPTATSSTFALPNHVPESMHVSNYDIVPRVGIVNNVPVSTTTTTTTTITTTASPSSSSSSCSSSTSSSTSTSTSSASSSLSYSFSSSSSASSCSSSSSLQIPCSPSKLQQKQQVVGPYTGMERGVPEGAASVTGHDMPQSGILLGSNSYVGHNPSGVSLPTHAQNSVYYAMNV